MIKTIEDHLNHTELGTLSSPSTPFSNNSELIRMYRREDFDWIDTKVVTPHLPTNKNMLTMLYLRDRPEESLIDGYEATEHVQTREY